MARGGTDEGLVQVDAVMRASRVLVAVVAQSISAVEDQVTFVQFRMLVVIASRGPLNLGEVARQMGVHPSNATRMVDKLVTAGLVERTDDPADRRYLSLRAIHLSRLHWCDAVPRLAGWCPVPAFAGRVPVMVRHGRGLLGLSGVATLAGRVRLPTM